MQQTTIEVLLGVLITAAVQVRFSDLSTLGDGSMSLQTS